MNSTPTSSEAELRLKELLVIRDGEPCAQGTQHRAPVFRAFGGKGLRLCVCWGGGGEGGKTLLLAGSAYLQVMLEEEMSSCGAGSLYEGRIVRGKGT